LDAGPQRGRHPPGHDPTGRPRPTRRPSGGHRGHQRDRGRPTTGRRVPRGPDPPNSFNAARPRWGASKAKSDPGDSFQLADYLRTDGHRLRRLQPTDAATRHLQAISRLRTDHLEAKTTATNQLSALLAVHWPGAKAIFARLDSDIALDFLERDPTPQAAQRLGEAA
jgi:hypothetical protein